MAVSPAEYGPRPDDPLHDLLDLGIGQVDPQGVRRPLDGARVLAEDGDKSSFSSSFSGGSAAAAIRFHPIVVEWLGVE